MLRVLKVLAQNQVVERKLKRKQEEDEQKRKDSLAMQQLKEQNAKLVEQINQLANEKNVQLQINAKQNQKIEDLIIQINAMQQSHLVEEEKKMELIKKVEEEKIALQEEIKDQQVKQVLSIQQGKSENSQKTHLLQFASMQEQNRILKQTLNEHEVALQVLASRSAQYIVRCLLKCIFL